MMVWCIYALWVLVVSSTTGMDDMYSDMRMDVLM